MEIIIIWAIFIIIVIMNINKAKKMQQERMQEHQRNMQEHNQNVPEYGSNMHRMQNNSSGNGSLSHGANLNKKDDSHAQSAPYMVNSYGEKQYIDPSVQTYSGSQKMTSAETEKLKQEIRSRNNFNGKNVTSHRAEAPVPQYVTPTISSNPNKTFFIAFISSLLINCTFDNYQQKRFTPTLYFLTYFCLKFFSIFAFCIKNSLQNTQITMYTIPTELSASCKFPP